jgi:hypothetical protein
MLIVFEQILPRRELSWRMIGKMGAGKANCCRSDK